MSSLAAARADNFYYPPEYRAEHGSLNKFRGSHPLGDRARKLHEGILVIRFEMPYKVFCGKCNEVIAKGVRFNAEKRTVGHYFSTKILEFSMNCCFCGNRFKIQTDPKNCEYVPVSGLRRKVETFDAEAAGSVAVFSAEERAKLSSDAMLKLEVARADLVKSQSAEQRLQQLMAFSDSRSSSDVQYDLSLKVRKRFREWKKEEIEREKPQNFALPLLPESAEDLVEAKETKFAVKSTRQNLKRKERVAQSSTIFPRKQTVKQEVIISQPIIAKKRKLEPCKTHPAIQLVVPIETPPRKPTARKSSVVMLSRAPR